MTKVLIVDDEKLIRWSLEEELVELGYSVQTAENGSEGYSLFLRNHPHVVLLDNRLPDMTGFDILSKIMEISPETIVIMMTGYGSIDDAVKAMKVGAYEYVSKPIEIDEIKILISRALESSRLTQRVSSQQEELNKKYSIQNMIGDSEKTKKTVEMILKIAASEAQMVLLEGESGVGKEVVAKAIHYESKRQNEPFVAINCSALPESLIESELFGYEKGAFTDAKRSKPGQLELANKGTLFLDEIGELNLQMQVKLLRVLETRSFKRVGGTREINIDVRIIAATNKNLMKEQEEGRFRQDLYYRLRVIDLVIPPLRDRIDDIPNLINHFINRFNVEFSKNFIGIEDEALSCCKKYSWPGNVRELKNMVERVLILESGSYINLDILPSEVKCETRNDEDSQNITLPEQGITLDEVESKLIMLALKRTNNNKTQAAELLGITRDTIRYKMSKHGIEKSIE